MTTHPLFPLAIALDTRMVERARHGALFNLRTGEPESPPAARSVPVYDVEVVVGQVTLRLSDEEESQA